MKHSNSFETGDERSLLLDKNAANKCPSKKGGVFAVLLCLGLLFVGLMVKWHVISQSLITSTSHETFNLMDDRGEDDPKRKDDDEEHADGPVGGRGNAVAPQLGKAFPLTILAQIAWKDFTTNIINFGSTNNDINNKLSLAQSDSMIDKMYLSQDDCDYAISYFEKYVDSSKAGLVDYQRVVVNDECKLNDGDETDDETDVLLMSKMTSRVVDYFYDNYGDYLSDHGSINDRVDIEIVKYVSDGTSYSGLHAENSYIDGTIINDSNNVDYVGIVFLNDNFDGGNLQFVGPNAIKIIRPHTGNGVLFGGGLEYAHRVTPVTNGDRYVLKIAFSKH